VAARFPLGYEQFPEEDVMKGPVPLLFSHVPEDAVARWKSSPEFAYRCLQALTAKLLATQNISR
jgi:hypothetical protein